MKISWIVRDAIDRYRNEYGVYRWNQWRVCIREIGCRFVWTSESDPSRGSINGRTIYIRRGMSKEETAQVAFHEVGHALLHAGTARFWSSKPGGIHILNKFERQADQFAEHFPVWDSAPSGKVTKPTVRERPPKHVLDMMQRGSDFLEDSTDIAAD